MSSVAEILRAGVAGAGSAIRVIRRLQPAGGVGDKIFPPTYGVDDRAPHKYCTERRRVAGVEVEAVVLDSVQSQANRMEQALLEAWRRKEINFPVVSVDFSAEDGLQDLGEITSLDAPHRLADALLRDSVVGGRPFRLTPEGVAFTGARVGNATAMYRLCPTALFLGIWDSTGPKGGLGAKFPRALVSEVVGIGAVVGRKTASRIDPAQIQNISRESPIYESKAGGWTLEPKEARTEKGKPVPVGTGRPSEINHGNVAPSIDERTGGVTIDYALQTIVLSLGALRKLRFPMSTAGEPLPPEKREKAEAAARTVLAALALAAVVYQAEEGFDLRSRCVLVPEGPLTFELIGSSAEVPQAFTLDRSGAQALLSATLAGASQHGLGWDCTANTPILRLTPAAKLADLIRRSRAHAANVPASD